MNYQFSKKLKDAGLIRIRHWFISPEDELLPEPTLEELIETVIKSIPDEPANYSFELRFQQWEANPGTEPLEIAWKWIASVKPLCFDFVGNSPEEAVANLWIYLNSQKEYGELNAMQKEASGAVFCEKHKVYYQDFCPECKQEK